MLAYHLARVEADTEGQVVRRRSAAPPPIQPSLDIDRAESCAAGTGESDHLAIARTLHLDAPMTFDLASHEFFYLAHQCARRSVTKPIGERGGSDDVGQSISLCPLELESLTWQTPETFSAMLANPFAPLDLGGR